MENLQPQSAEQGVGGPKSPVGRRGFLRYAGMTTAAGVLLTACSKNELQTVSPKSGFRVGANEVNLGSGDVGILNYAYALEQLEAAFYQELINRPFAGMTIEERRILMDIRDHERVHRDFFKTALGSNAIPMLEADFSAIDFSSRASVLGTAKVFEDLGVSAYNGAGRLLQNATFLLLAGKIVSVEARHAAVIRDLLSPKSMSFAGDDVVDPATGLDLARSPMQVLPLAQPFIKNTISGANLPTM